MIKNLKCKICKSKKIRSVLNLGSQPPANSLQKKKIKQIKYPLHLVFCNNCAGAQLSLALDPRMLFSKYSWVTSTSKTANDYSKFFYKKISKYLKPGSSIVEVASNDGLFLKVFKKNSHKILGIDPAKNIAKVANQKGLKTLPKFFDFKVSNEIKKKYFKNINLVFARNVIPHVKNIHSVIKGIANLCGENSVVAIEFHYGKEIQKDLQYDSIYHEHIFYFTIKSLTFLFNKYGLKPFDVFKSPISGGSLVIIMSKKEKKVKKNLLNLIRNEKLQRVNTYKKWKEFGILSKKHANKFKELMKKNRELKLIGYGASARSSTFLNFCNLNSNFIQFIIDQNPLKKNLYTPGTNIPIYLFKDVKNQLTDKALILLAWNFKNEILKFLKIKKFKGKIFIPFKNK
jgi:hypothetical protein